jgi:sugar transferase (PEP-CTERM/EpsH1 system associated)
VGPSGPLEAQLRADVPVFSLNKGEHQRMRLAALRLARLFLGLGADIVHSRNWPAVDAIPAATMVRVPVRIHNEEGWEVEDPEGVSRRRNIIRRLLAPAVDRFVVVSEDLGRWLNGTVGVPRQKIVLVPNGVDTRRFSSVKRAEGRAALGLSEDVPVVGAVGRLNPVKDHTTLLWAFAGLAARRPDVMLVIVGDGGLRTRLGELVRGLGLASRVRFLGERSDIPQLLSAFDIFALSSIKEGMSFTILEAMSTGLPIVVTRVGGNAELIEHDVSGTLVPAGDAVALAAGLDRYLEEPGLAAAHGRAARRRAVERFSLDVMLEGYRELYLSLAERRARAGRLMVGGR